MIILKISLGKILTQFVRDYRFWAVKSKHILGAPISIDEISKESKET